MSYTWAPTVQKTEKYVVGKGSLHQKFHEKLQLKRALQNVSIYAHGISFTAASCLVERRKLKAEKRRSIVKIFPLHNNHYLFLYRIKQRTMFIQSS